MTDLYKMSRDLESFIIDEVYDKLPADANNLQKLTNGDTDLVSEINKLLKSTKKEAEPVYRIQHQKAGDTEELITSLLPVLDSLTNLLVFSEKFADNEVLQNWMKSIEAVYKKMLIVLGKNGLQTIDSLGTLVDFTLHEVVEYRHTPDGISNIIIEEKQKGYKYKGKVIREARVVVSNAESGS